ncbi:hypothetical protein [Paraglaciecola sp. 20A4]|uniref:hypothetical protein n=1 Tax=Paraglaciecola sp. 20A4 TaxID=2687288 RepID=UPI001408A9A3|nr:hypothetical protein [Paraglaciecola sp. 20A4]
MQPTLCALQQEWVTLQNQYDSYEKFACVIKLVCISLVATMLLLLAPNVFVAAFIFVLWLQEAIWKTFQARIEVRLLSIEKILSSPEEMAHANQIAMQFNSTWLETRPSMLGLLQEYATSALRPTVALHYLLLIVIVIFTDLAIFAQQI